jgi:hypothetical protein
MATAEDIRDIMKDEYPHLTPTIPEIGRIVKFKHYDPEQLYFTLDAIEPTLSFNHLTDQLTVDYRLAMVGSEGDWQLSFAISNRDKAESYYSWEYVEST